MATMVSFPRKLASRRRGSAAKDSSSANSNAAKQAKAAKFAVAMQGTETKVTSTGSKHVEYVMKVTQSHSWVISQRYSAFEALHKKLRKAYPSLKLPTLPSTRWLVRSFDKDYLEKKQAKLQRYVAELLACSPKIIRNADVQLFLTGNHKEFMSVEAPPPTPDTTVGVTSLTEPVATPTPAPAAATSATTSTATTSTATTGATAAASSARKLQAATPVNKALFRSSSNQGVASPSSVQDTGHAAASPDKRVSTAVCRAAHARARSGAHLGEGLHERSLVEAAADPVIALLKHKQAATLSGYDSWDEVQEAVDNGLVVLCFTTPTTKVFVSSPKLRKLSSSSSAATAGDTGTVMDMHLSGEVVLNGHKCRLSCAVSSTKLIGTGHLRVLPKPDKNAATKAVAADLSSVM